MQAKLLIQLNATLNAAHGKGNSGGKGNTTATANASGKGNSSTMASVPALRAGYPMYDGFDDSSTFMSREIVLAFAKHYPEPGKSTLHPKTAPTTTSTLHLLICLRSLGPGWLSGRCWAGFNCSEVADDTDPGRRSWLSWGNSWRRPRCAWRVKLAVRIV